MPSPRPAAIAASPSAGASLASRALAAVVAGVLLTGCSSFWDSVGFAPNHPDPESVKTPAGERPEPDHIVIRHVLVAFEKTGIQGVMRSQDEAERLAQQVLAQAKSGRDFSELVRLYSDDRHADGRYAIANWGITPREGEMERERLARGFTGFAKLAFALEPGQIAMQPFDETDSPFGWHVVVRER